MKLKWKVAAAPTGPYRSFFKRGWPTAEFSTGQVAAQITCADAYSSKQKTHGELTVRIADYSSSSGFQWRTLKARAKTLDEAKTLAQQFFQTHPEFAPQGVR